MPDEDEQEAAYREAAEALGGRPMIVRTLDAGADKPLPSLGSRPRRTHSSASAGIRLGLERTELLGASSARSSASPPTIPCGMMFPMVATLEELRAARAALERGARRRCGADAHARGRA